MNAQQKKEFDEWLSTRPQVIKDLAAKFPPDKTWRIKEGAPYGITCPGTVVQLVSYSEDGTLGVVVMPEDKLPDAIAHEVALCEQYKKEWKNVPVKANVEPQWVEETKDRHSASPGCKCVACSEGTGALKEMEDSFMKKHGWMVHYVSPDSSYPYNMNIHTHGFVEKFKHPDLQICAPLDPDTVQSILTTIVKDHLEKGKVFVPGEKYKEVIAELNVMFVKAKDGDRDVLRIIFPGENGKFNGQFSKTQMEDIK